MESNHDDFFTLGGSHRGEGGIERVILYRNGWGVCSLGSYCRQAGKHYTMLPIVGNTATNDNEKLMQIGKILSSISEKGVKPERNKDARRAERIVVTKAASGKITAAGGEVEVNS